MSKLSSLTSKDSDLTKTKESTAEPLYHFTSLFYFALSFGTLDALTASSSMGPRDSTTFPDDDFIEGRESPAQHVAGLVTCAFFLNLTFYNVVVSKIGQCVRSDH